MAALGRLGVPLRRIRWAPGRRSVVRPSASIGAAAQTSLPSSSRRGPKLLAAGGLLATGVSVVQIVDIKDKWVREFRERAMQCSGPTEGLERGEAARAVAVAVESSEARLELRLPLPERLAGASRRPPLLLFLGDSLVSGVGAQDEGAEPEAAALPKSVAARLAKLGAGPVRWASVGITGADVQQLTEEGLPKLREKIQEYKAQAETVVVVLVVGVNDLRKAQLGTYRPQLRSLVDELRHIVCKERAVDAVVLPELRMENAPLLQRWPLNFFVGPVCSLWEREKTKAISFLEEVHVLPYPAHPDVDDDGSESQPALFCADGMHPSAHGYKWWADSLATQIHGLLHARKAQMAGGIATDALGALPI